MTKKEETTAEDLPVANRLVAAANPIAHCLLELRIPPNQIEIHRLESGGWGRGTDRVRKGVERLIDFNHCQFHTRDGGVPCTRSCRGCVEDFGDVSAIDMCSVLCDRRRRFMRRDCVFAAAVVLEKEVSVVGIDSNGG